MNSRYLLLFGGSCCDDCEWSPGDVFCVDLQDKKLLLRNEFEYRLPFDIIPQNHYFLNDTLYIFDGYIEWETFGAEIRKQYKDKTAFFVLKVSFAESEWNRIRLTWIAFLKNKSNDKCLLAKLPHMIVSIEKMLKPPKVVWIDNKRLGFFKISAY